MERVHRVCVHSSDHGWFFGHDRQGLVFVGDFQHNESVDRIHAGSGEQRLAVVGEGAQVFEVLAHDALFVGGHVIRPAVAGAVELDNEVGGRCVHGIVSV